MTRAASTSAQRRFERSRWITAAVLAFFVMVMLIEVVIAPGTMIRRHLHVAPRRVEHDRNPGNERASPSLLVNCERLRKLSKEVESSFANFHTEMTRRIAIDITARDQTNVPAVMLRDPVAQNAWADIRQSMPEVADEISRGRTVLQGTTARINYGSPSEHDERDVIDAIGGLENAQRSLRRMQAELEHIEIGLPIAPNAGQPNR